MKYVLKSVETGWYYGGGSTWVKDITFAKKYSKFNLFRYVSKWMLNKVEKVAFSCVIIIEKS